MPRLRACLTEGAKLSESVVDHNHHMERVREATSDEKRAFPFIVIEGPDGCGKTCVSKALAQHLGFVRYVTPPQLFQNLNIKSRLERPGLEIARYLYYISSNLYAGPELRSLLLHAGIICDRWLPSTQIYHEMLGCRVAEIELLQKELPYPDLTIVLDVSDDVQSARIEERGPMFDHVWENSPGIRQPVNGKYRALGGDHIVHVVSDNGVDETVSRCLEVIGAHDLL